MVEYFRTVKVFKVGTVYRTPPNRFYVIRRIGTDASADVSVVVNGVTVLRINSSFAPISKTSSNLLGPLNLGELYIVVPPNIEFEFKGPSGARVLIDGVVGVLNPGEVMPAEYQARFTAQGRHRIEYIAAALDLGTDVKWKANEERTIVTVRPRTIELFTFNGIVMARVDNAPSQPGTFALRFYKDGTPLDILTTEPGPLGIDIAKTPYPPRADLEFEPFTLRDRPIVLEGDHELAVTMINISGQDISPPSGSSLVARVFMLYEYVMRG